MNSKTKGHGYFRKKKWAKGLASGIALAGVVAFSTGAVFADDVTTTTPSSAPSVATQPVSTNDNDAYAKSAETSTGTETVTVDNSSVDTAAQTAASTGVDVSKTATVDEGTATNSADLSQAKDTIVKDQAQQVQDINTATKTQSANNGAYVDAQTAINNNNDYVAQAKGNYSPNVTVSNDSSTATDGTAQANEAAKVTAQQTLDNNKAAVNNYIIAKDKYDATVSQAATLNSAVEAAANDIKSKGINVTTTSQVVNSVDEVTALQNLLAQNLQTVQAYEQALAAYNSSNAVTVSATVATQNVDNQTYGNSFMNGTINADGTFTFTHDMNDGENDVYGVLGSGTLTGKLNYTSTSNGDGSITITLTSIDLYSYSYTSNRQNLAVNQNLNFHVQTIGGTEIYSTYHNGNYSFTDTINRSVSLGESYVINPTQSTGNIAILNIDDNWIYNTHGQAVVDFSNPNQPVSPISIGLVEAANPEKPTLELTSLSNTQNQTVSATYHDYKLAYAPIVSKTVSDTDGTNTDGKTIAKGDSEKYTLVHDNVYANIKVGDVIKIVDPLEAGAIANISETLADATKKGWTVSYDTASETYTLTATYQGQKFESPIVLWNPEYDNGYYDNTYKVFVNGYEAYSNTVSNRTPSAPIPVKTITDTSSKDINGSTVFDKNVVFGLTTDYTPYTKVTAPSEAIGKGFAIMDDVQDGAFTVNEDGITLTAADKTNVKDLFTMYHVLSDSARTDAINAILAQDGLSPTGEFYLWVAKDPSSFYTNYIKAGKNITVSLPSTLNVPAGTPVVNDFYQIDFGNSYLSNKVVVQVPDVSPQKHALDAKDNEIVLDGQEVSIGDYIDYLLDGVTVPVNHDTLWQYDGIDNLDLTHDQYTGNWKGVIKGTEYTATSDLVLGYDVTTVDGTVIKAGDTVPTGTKYQFSFEFDQSTNSDFINKVVTVTWNAETGRWAYTINKDFLNSLGVKGTFDADFYVEIQRIAAGDVVNTFVNIVNGREMPAEVTTHTPAPVSPETPSSPVQLTDKVQKASVLPETGDKGSILAIIGGILLSGLGLVGIRKNKKELDR